MYVVVILENESDTPGVEKVLGPYATYTLAHHIRTLAQEDLAPDHDADLIQVARVEAV